MHFTGPISLGGGVLTRVAGNIYGISGTQGGYYGDFVPDRVLSRPTFDPDTLYQLDIDRGPSMGVHVMNSPGPGAADGEAVFRSRGIPVVGRAYGSRSGHPDAVKAGSIGVGGRAAGETRVKARCRGAWSGAFTMSDKSGLMPEEFIDKPEPPFVQLKVGDLGPEHGEGFIGVGDVAVDLDRVCWVLIDAPRLRRGLPGRRPHRPPKDPRRRLRDPDGRHVDRVDLQAHPHPRRLNLGPRQGDLRPGTTAGRGEGPANDYPPVPAAGGVLTDSPRCRVGRAPSSAVPTAPARLALRGSPARVSGATEMKAAG